MPLLLPHSELLDSKLRNLYRSDTEKACASAGAKSLDFDNHAPRRNIFSSINIFMVSVLKGLKRCLYLSWSRMAHRDALMLSNFFKSL